MAAIGSGPLARGDGVVVSFTAGSGPGGMVLYTVTGVWLFGAEGIYKTDTPVKPIRPFKDSDNQIVSKAAQVGDPVTFTNGPDGLRLWCPTEEYDTTDCEQP